MELMYDSHSIGFGDDIYNKSLDKLQDSFNQSVKWDLIKEKHPTIDIERLKGFLIGQLFRYDEDIKEYVYNPNFVDYIIDNLNQLSIVD